MCQLHPVLNPELAGKVLSRLALEAKDDRGSFGRRPKQSSFNAFTERTKARLRKATAQLYRGDIGLADWKDLCLIVLRDAHEEAARLGRRQGGDLQDRSAFDTILARQAMQQEETYLHRFFEQLREKDPRYRLADGSFRKDAINQRLGSYVQKTRGTANQGFVDTSSPEDLFDWVMLNAEHCGLCPERQEGSPYTKATLPSYPGDGQTPCMSNCGCVLAVIGFARAFDPPPSLDDVNPEDKPDLTAPLTQEEERSFFAI
jgi:hypothetical protein